MNAAIYILAMLLLLIVAAIAVAYWSYVKDGQKASKPDLPVVPTQDQDPDFSLPATIASAQAAVEWYQQNAETHSGTSVYAKGVYCVGAVRADLQEYCKGAVKPEAFLFKSYHAKTRQGTHAIVYTKGQGDKKKQFVIRYKYEYLPLEALMFRTEQPKQLEDYLVVIDKNGNPFANEGDAYIMTTKEIYLVYPSEPSDEIKHETFANATTAALLHVDTGEDERTIIELASSGQRHYIPITEKMLSPELLDHSYPSVRCFMRGSESYENGDSAASLMQLVLDMQGSVAIGDSSGTGKTYMAMHVCAAYASHTANRVYRIEPALMLQNKDWYDVFDPEYNNLVYIDQAHSLLEQDDAQIGQLLDMISGFTQKALNLRFLVVYNDRGKTFNSEFMGRERGRFVQFRLEELTQKQASNLGKMLQNNPTHGCEFNLGAFHDYLDREGKSVRLSEVYQFMENRAAKQFYPEVSDKLEGTTIQQNVSTKKRRRRR